MHGLMLSQSCMHRGYLTNKNHPTLSCEYLMQRITKTVWGSPFSQRGPGKMGTRGPQNFMTPELLPRVLRVWERDYEVPRHSAGCARRYVHVRTWYVRRFSQCARASAACIKLCSGPTWRRCALDLCDNGVARGGCRICEREGLIAQVNAAEGIEACSADQSAQSAEKFFAFIFQLSGWALVALSCFALQVPDVRVATRVPGSMLKRVSA